MTSHLTTGVSTGELDRVLAGLHHDPHSVLGAHPGGDGITVRTLRPMARTVAVLLPDGRQFPMEHIHGGVFAALLPADVTGVPGRVPDYRLAVTYPGGDGTAPQISDDPYRHQPTVGEVDLHLIGEGRHEELWRVLGAHTREFGVATDLPPAPCNNIFEKISGTSFAVWAPNARGVRVIGDFNHWDGRGHPMRSLGGSGVWELFVPGVGEGARYKYEICGPDGHWKAKADPMAALAETPPATASVVTASRHEWADGGAGAAQPADLADERVRGAHRVLAARAVLPPACRPAHLVCDRTRVHPCGVPAGRGAPVRRLLGLPGDLVLRAVVPVRLAG